MNPDFSTQNLVDGKAYWRPQLRVLTHWLIAALFLFLGALLWVRDYRGESSHAIHTRTVQVEHQAIDWQGVNKDVQLVVTRAEEIAKVAAEKEVKKILTGIEERVAPFLRNHFSFLSRQASGITGTFRQIGYWLCLVSESADENQHRQLNEGLARVVIKPEQTRLQLEDVVRFTLAQYLGILEKGIEKVRLQYQIPAPDWAAYLKDLAHIQIRLANHATTSLSVKVLLTSSVVAMGALSTQVLPHTIRLVQKVFPGFASEGSMLACEGLLARSGARIGGKVLGGLVVAGTVVWELWEHRQFHSSVIPVMLTEFNRYLDLVRQQILHDPQYGVCTLIHSWTVQIVSQLEQQQFSPRSISSATQENTISSLRSD